MLPLVTWTSHINLQVAVPGSLLSRGREKTNPILIPGGASAPPDPLNKSAWRPPKCSICIGNPIQFNIWGPPGQLIGGVWGGGCPPRNKVMIRLFSTPGQYVWAAPMNTALGPGWPTSHWGGTVYPGPWNIYIYIFNVCHSSLSHNIFIQDSMSHADSLRKIML